MKCNDCKYYESADGTCRRHAPGVTERKPMTNVHASSWPYVSAWDWCGDGETNEPAKGEEPIKENPKKKQEKRKC